MLEPQSWEHDSCRQCDKLEDELNALCKRIARLEAALEKIIVSTDNWVVEIAQEALREDKP